MTPLRQALLISYVAVVWSLVSGVAAVIVGVSSKSTALIGTGADVIADMLSSVFLIWRFRVELNGGRAGESVERRAHFVAAYALLIVAVGITAASIAHLVVGGDGPSGAAGPVIAAVSLLVLPALAMAKFRIAARVPSPALRTDGIITFVGATTALLSLVGLVLTEAFDWSSADPVAALVIAAIAFVTGGRELFGLLTGHDVLDDEL